MRRKSIIAVAVAIATLVVTVGPASAAMLAAGALDPDFGTDGRSDPLHTSGDAVVVQPDGRIIAIGSRGIGEYWLARYNSDGSLDTTFGPRQSGVILTPHQRMRSRTPIVATQLDDGESKTIIRLDDRLLRYDVNGSLDQTFGINGKAANPHGYSVWNGYPAWIDDIETTAVGDRIVTLGVPGEFSIGVSGGYQPVPQPIFAYTGDGAPDGSFGNDGMVLLGSGMVGDHLRFRDVVIQPDGKIVATGGQVTIRLLPDGELDPSFGDEGIALDVSNHAGSNQHVEVDSVDRLLVMRCKTSPAGFGTVRDGCEMVRYLPGGSIDLTYGTSGRSPLPDYAMRNFEIDARNRVVVFGARWEATDSASDLALVRLLEDGAIDSAFGDGGVVLTPSYYYATLPPSVGALQSDDKIVRTGTVFGLSPTRGHTTKLMYVWRYLAEPQGEEVQTGTEAVLSGFVTDGKTAAAISGAAVDCGEGRTTVTVTDGGYALQLPIGRYFCTASADGYRTVKSRVEVTETGAILDFSLRN